MTFVAPVRTFTEFAPLLPELTVVVGAFGLLMLDLFLDDRRRVITHALSIATLLIAAAFIATGVGGQGNVMEGLFLRDTASDALKFVTLLISALALVYLWPFMRERGLYRGEIPILMLFAVIGMMLLVSAGNLTMIYLGLELLALCSYALVAVDRNSKLATEAGMKYFVLGSLSSGLLLFGLSLIYGATGTLYLDGINAAAATVTGEDRTLPCGCPSTLIQTFAPRTGCNEANIPVSRPGSGASALTHWPVQIRLVPPTAPFLRGADLLVAADCTPVAYPRFHDDLLRGKTVLLGCPKFDDAEAYVQKFAEIFRTAAIKSVTIVVMEVPCCQGLPVIVRKAMALAGKEIPIDVVVITSRGEKK